MGKRKMKGGISPPKSEYGRFKDLLRRLVAVPRKEVEEKMEEYREKRAYPDEEKSSS